ncbi:MAG: hypothetical protein EAZ86_00040, partial [Oscillatoriales cyanobacterium]
PSGAVAVNFNVTNQPPAGQTDNYTIPHTKVFNQQAPGVLGNDSDLDGDILTAKVLSNPINGKVNFNTDGSFSYTPNAGFAGPDSFTYSVSDGVSPSPAVFVNLNVTNQPPAGQTDNYTIPHTKSATASATEYRRLGLLRSISMSPTSHLLDKQTITVPHLILPSTFLRSQVS